MFVNLNIKVWLKHQNFQILILTNTRIPFPTDTPRVFHVETTWKRTIPHRFNVEYTWSVCRVCQDRQFHATVIAAGELRAQSTKLRVSETATRMYSVKKVLLKILQNSQENICPRVSFLMKFEASGLQRYWKRTLARSSQRRCSIKKDVLKNFAVCFGSLIRALNLVKFHECTKWIIDDSAVFNWTIILVIKKVFC